MVIKSKNKMFKLTALMPTALLRAIYNSSLTELVKRGNVVSPCPDHTTITEYGVYQVKLYTEQEASYATTWAVYKDNAIVCRGNDEFYLSMGEAESSALEWIDSQRVSASTARSV